uniref:Uncharacterized protein n=1 Tax=Takifugu rubripes TaxID=31033 RepID=A0A3B5K6Z5_TAKRU
MPKIPQKRQQKRTFVSTVTKGQPSWLNVAGVKPSAALPCPTPCVFKER